MLLVKEMSDESIFLAKVQSLMSFDFRLFSKKENDDLKIFIDDSEKNSCAILKFKDFFIKDHPIMYVNSLRYGKKESKCTIGGNKLLQNILLLCPKLVSEILLYDESTKIIRYKDLTYHIPLTAFLKFSRDEGWYESFGFKPIGYIHKYNDSFNDLRKCSFSQSYKFIWFLYIKLKKKQDLCDYEDVIQTLAIPIFANYEEMDGYSLYQLQLEVELHNISMTNLEYFFTFFPEVDLAKMDEDSEAFKVYSITQYENDTFWQKLRPRTTLKLLKKIFSRDVQSETIYEDAFKFITMMCDVLKVFIALNLLYVPEVLSYKKN